MEPTGSSTLMESISLLSSKAITLGLNLSKRDYNIFLTALESGIGSPRLSEQLTISLSLEFKKKNLIFMHCNILKLSGKHL